MKTIIYSILCCMAFLPATAQFKVGASPTTINAGAILQADAIGTRGAFQLPRVTLTGTGDVTTVASPQAGFTVYNTATAGTAPNNVTPGYYYYDGAQWQKVLASGNGSTTNIYTADGTLGGNRTVSQGASTLAFNPTVTNGFSVDGTTFSVDGANHRIGIGTAAPGYNLDVSGTARVGTMPVGTWGSDAIVTADGAGQLKKSYVAVGGCPVCAVHEDPVTHVIPFGTTYYYDANGNYTGIVVLPPAGRFPGDVFTFQHSAQSGTAISNANTSMGSYLAIYSAFSGGASFTWSGNIWMLTATSAGGGAGNWATTGNYGTDASVNYIGTSDNVDVVFKRAGVRSGLLSYNNNASWGVGALNPLSTGTNNTAIGGYALAQNTTGGANTAMGPISLYSNTTGSNNIAIGHQSMYWNTTGNNNTATGFQSLISNTTGNYNIANGFQSLYNNTTGSANLAGGYQSLYYNSTGNNNTATGSLSMISNTTGNFNTATGSQTLYSNSTGIYNTAHGYQSLYNNTIGNYNAATGFQSLVNSSAGNNNTAFGTSAAGNITIGSNNIAIGANTNLASATANDQLNIGNAIFGTGLNGSVGAPAGNIGIGTTAPTTALDVNGAARIRTITNVANGTSVTPLFADANGNIVKSAAASGSGTSGSSTFLDLGLLGAGATSASVPYDPSGIGVHKVYVQIFEGSNNNVARDFGAEFLSTCHSSFGNDTFKPVQTIDALSNAADTYTFPVSNQTKVSWQGVADGTAQPNFIIIGTTNGAGCNVSIQNLSSGSYTFKVFVQKMF